MIESINRFFSTVGPTVIVPIVIFLVALVMRVHIKTAIMSALYAGIGLTGFGWIINSFTPILTKIVKQMVETTGADIPVVDIGWEALLPPRTKARNKTNPPQKMMKQIGVPSSITHSSIIYSEDQEVFWFSLILHFTFSNFFAIVFIYISQYWEKTSMGRGTLYGLVICDVWHLGLMPATKTIPSPHKQPFDEHLSEFLGHMVWGWTIAASAYYLIAKANK